MYKGVCFFLSCPPVHPRVVFLVHWSLTLNVAIDPVHVRAHSSEYRVRVSRTCFACPPRGRPTDDPLATPQARQGATAVTITGTGSLSSDTDHGAFIHFLSVCIPALVIADHWG